MLRLIGIVPAFSKWEFESCSQEQSQDEAATIGQRKRWQEPQGGQSTPGA